MEFRIAAVLVGMLTLPGWAALALSGGWRRWEVLQRWVVAVGLSIAFYPVLFYTTRWAIPFLTFGPYKMSAMLLLCAGIIGWRMRGHLKEQFAFDRLELVALGVFGMTLFTRFWIIRHHPYPAWSDSLHHAILTRLTAVQGQLPTTLEPYFPIPLDQYHLGLYSLTATTQWLAQVPAHTALLWTAQALNGLCGLGVYLVLDRKVGRVGAIVGAAVVGLLSHQPAWYVNWGRFTQLSSQTILLIAWLVTWEAIKMWKLPWREHRAEILWSTAFAALLTGAVFLLHFRVAAFYLPLVAMSVVWELWEARREGMTKRLLLGVTLVGAAVLIVIMPTLWKAMHVYISTNLEYAQVDQTALASDEVSETVQRFYHFPWSSLSTLGARWWLIYIAGICAVFGLLKRNKLVVALLVWTAVLYFFGNSYVLGIPFISFTNLGAILIMLYLPIGLVTGWAAEEGVAFFRPRWGGRAIQVAIALVLTSGFIASHVRVTDVEPYRYFVTPGDVKAMQWIRENTPEEALFAVNTYFWLPQAPHGTDAGYWIPYFTGRRTTAGVMLLSLGEWDYLTEIVEMSRAVEKLEKDNLALEELQAMGVDYVYIGRRGDFSGPGLNVHQLSQADSTEVVYQNGGVSVLYIGFD